MTGPKRPFPMRCLHVLVVVSMVVGSSFRATCCAPRPDSVGLVAGVLFAFLVLSFGGPSYSVTRRSTRSLNLTHATPTHAHALFIKPKQLVLIIHIEIIYSHRKETLMLDIY